MQSATDRGGGRDSQPASQGKGREGDNPRRGEKTGMLLHANRLPPSLCPVTLSPSSVDESFFQAKRPRGARGGEGREEGRRVEKEADNANDDDEKPPPPLLLLPLLLEGFVVALTGRTDAFLSLPFTSSLLLLSQEWSANVCCRSDWGGVTWLAD